MSRTHYTGLYVDTETGGTDERLYALTSICVGAFTLRPDSEPEVQALYLPIRPPQSLIITEKAAQVQGKTVGQLYTTGEPESVQMGKLSYWLWNDGLIGLPVWAHNADFDRRFLSAACDRNYPQWWKPNLNPADQPNIAVCALAGRDSRWSCTRYLAEYLVQKGLLEQPRKPDGTPSVSLDPLMERLGIPGRQGEGHDAHEDVKLGVAVLDALLRLDGWWG